MLYRQGHWRVTRRSSSLLAGCSCSLRGLLVCLTYHSRVDPRYSKPSATSSGIILVIKIAPYGLAVHAQYNRRVGIALVQMVYAQVTAVGGFDGGVTRCKRVVR